MNIVTLIGILAETLGMLTLGWQVGKYGSRNTVFPSRFPEARQGFQRSVALLAIGAIIYGINAEEVRAQPLTVILPFSMLFVSFSYSRWLLVGTFNMFGLDMETLSEINQIRWMFIKGSNSDQLSDSANLLGDILTMHKDWRVRRGAALSFHVHHNQESFSYLLGGLNDLDVRVQYMCMNSIGRIGMGLAAKGAFDIETANHVLDCTKALLSKPGLNSRVGHQANKLAKGLKNYLDEQQ